MTILLWHLVPRHSSLSTCTLCEQMNKKYCLSNCSSRSKRRDICLVLKRSVPSYASYFAGAFTTLKHHWASSSCIDSARVGILLALLGLKHKLQALSVPWVYCGDLAHAPCWQRSGRSSAGNRCRCRSRWITLGAISTKAERQAHLSLLFKRWL